MKLTYNGKELDAILGPKYRTVLLWSTPLGAGGGGGARRGLAPAVGGRAPAERARRRHRHPPGRSRSILRRA